MQHATGAFEVILTPLPSDNDPARRANVGRMSLEKQFKGDIAGTSVGELLFSGDAHSGAYVGIERITATLHGKQGAFVLAHHSLMNRDTPERWTVSVVPDSGTGELKGITGAMRIIFEQGRHSYEFDYVLPE